VQIMRILGRVLRWVLSSNCAFCDKRKSDLAPACVQCDRSIRTEVVDVAHESRERLDDLGGETVRLMSFDKKSGNHFPGLARDDCMSNARFVE